MGCLQQEFGLAAAGIPAEARAGRDGEQRRADGLAIERYGLVGQMIAERILVVLLAQIFGRTEDRNVLHDFHPPAQVGAPCALIAVGDVVHRQRAGIDQGDALQIGEAVMEDRAFDRGARLGQRALEAEFVVGHVLGAELGVGIEHVKAPRLVAA